MQLADVGDALAGKTRPRVWTPSPEEMAVHKVTADDLRKFAKRVGQPIQDVDEAPYRVSGRSLFAERDARAAT